MLKIKRLAVAAMIVAGVVSAGYAQRAARADSINFERPVQYKIFSAPSTVMAFAVGRNVLWYATEMIVVAQSMTDARTNHTHRQLGGIPPAGVKAMAFDSGGRLWVAGDNGVASYSGGTGVTGGTWTSYTEDNGLPSSVATSLTIAPNNDVWVGTEGGAARFSGGSWRAFTESDGLPSNKVQAVIADSRGRIYLGTNRGLSVYDGTTFTNHNARNTGASGLEWNNITILAKEPNKDVIWMTDGPSNINSFDGQNWRRFMEIQQGTTSIMNDTRRTWFGSERGLLRFNGEEWVSRPQEHGVHAEKVHAMWRDDQGNLWFGMEKGVMRMDNPYRR